MVLKSNQIERLYFSFHYTSAYMRTDRLWLALGLAEKTKLDHPDATIYAVPQFKFIYFLIILNQS